MMAFPGSPAFVPAVIRPLVLSEGRFSSFLTRKMLNKLRDLFVFHDVNGDPTNIPADVVNY